jgi:hypothetical protein
MLFMFKAGLALASSLPSIKGCGKSTFHVSDIPSLSHAAFEGFRKNTSLYNVVITGYEHDKWSQELNFSLYRNKFSRLLQDSILTIVHRRLWSRALGSVEGRGLTYSSTCLPPKQV